MNNNKHLTLDQRVMIQKIISENRNKNGSLKIKLKDIADMLGKDPTTISKEVKKHRIIHTVDTFNTIKYNIKCIKFNECAKEIKKTTSCIKSCSEFIERKCKHISKFPYVCNGCCKRAFCNFTKYLYYSDEANKMYNHIKVESRKGIDLEQGKFVELNHIISKGIKKGQPLAHICISNPDLPKGIRTIYNYIENGYLDVKNIDLRRKVTYKPRYKFKDASKRIYKAKIGRLYKDYLEYIQTGDYSIVQMDTVEGVKGGKSLLTLHFVKYQFQLAYLMESLCSSETLRIFNEIQTSIGIDAFKELFEVILTDNGKEFSDPESLEVDDETGEIRCRIFFCDAYRSSQKAECEKNHEYIRYVLPKGTSFNNLNDEKISLLMSHINSTIRPKTKATPYQFMELAFGKDVLDSLNIKYVLAEHILLKPILIK